MTLLLPTWTDRPQELEIRDLPDPAPFEVPADDQPSEEPETDSPELPEGTPLVEVRAAEIVAGAAPEGADESQPATTAHLLMPQGAAPIPSSVRFRLSSPASDIWFQGLTWVVEAEQCEADQRKAEAIVHYQNARSAYQQVAERYPEWQADIIGFRLQDLERNIRRLVEEKRQSGSDDGGTEAKRVTTAGSK